MAKVDDRKNDPSVLSRDGGALVLIGFMGAGKSTTLRGLEGFSEALDSDELLERDLGMSISDYFASEGEESFRKRESEMICEILSGANGATAIALGGGALGSDAVLDALQGHTVVWLSVTPDEAWSRVSGGAGRPLASDRERFEHLLVERTTTYRETADAVVFADSPRSSVTAVEGILENRHLLEEARLFWFAAGSGSYPVWIGRNLIGNLPVRASGRPFCLSDSTVAGLYEQRIAAERVFVVDAGEESKSIESAERIWQEMTDAGMLREDHLVALGGGVVGDLGGFCAATYQRGVELVQIPTSLVAQVDSAFGGKTGVDLPGAKNFIGSFHQPVEVIVDLDCLETLPAEEAAAGWAEVVKTALLEGGDLWEAVKSFDPGDLRDPRAMAPIVTACIEVKLGVVAADERDGDRRQILNLGHTIGHGIETAGGYSRYRHGEAVSLGLLAAMTLSGADSLRSEVAEVLSRAGLPTSLDPGIATDAVEEALAHDKKRDAEGVKFVLIDSPGDIRWGQRVADEDIRAAIERLREDGSGES